MNLQELVGTAKDAVTVKRVFGEPFEKNGVTVITAAAVKGGVGGGTGHDKEGQEGEGGGFGMAAKPAGAYVIKGDQVTWRPAVDPNGVIVVIGAVVIAFLITRARVEHFRARAARRHH